MNDVKQFTYFSLPFPEPIYSKSMTAKLTNGKFLMPAKSDKLPAKDVLEHVQLVRPGVLKALTQGMLPFRSPKKANAAIKQLQAVSAQPSPNASTENLSYFGHGED